MRRAMAAVILLAAACKGGGGEGDWIKAKRTEVSGTVKGVAFTLQIPEGFVPDSGLPTGAVGWEDKGDTVGFSVSLTEKPITSIEAAVEHGILPEEHRTIEKQEAIADGFVVRRMSGTGVAFVDVFKNGPAGTLQCQAGATAKGMGFDDLPGTLAAMQEVCTSLRAK